jgi:hypothetical protein
MTFAFVAARQQIERLLREIFSVRRACKAPATHPQSYNDFYA